jgi:hypothetical protein
VRYQGSGQLVFRATPDAALPKTSDETLAASAQGDALRVQLPASEKETTAVVPLPKTCTAAFVAAGGKLAVNGELDVQRLTLWETTADWQHKRLKKPGETRLKVSILSPRPGAKLPRGSVPVVAMVEGKPPQAPQVRIGDQVGTDSADFVALLFQANGLQSKSHGFRNCVYVNGKYLTDIEPKRDVTSWEWFAFPLSAKLWRQAEAPQFRLTAGTPDDGSGANPPANNEDYQARSLVLLDGGAYRCDPALPVGRVLALGDNGKTPRTLLDCSPSQPFEPRRWRAVQQVVDTSALPPGPTKVAVTWGGASAEVTIILVP